MAIDFQQLQGLLGADAVANPLVQALISYEDVMGTDDDVALENEDFHDITAQTYAQHQKELDAIQMQFSHLEGKSWIGKNLQRSVQSFGKCIGVFRTDSVKAQNFSAVESKELLVNLLADLTESKTRWISGMLDNSVDINSEDYKTDRDASDKFAVKWNDAIFQGLKRNAIGLSYSDKVQLYSFDLDGQGSYGTFSTIRTQGISLEEFELSLRAMNFLEATSLTEIGAVFGPGYGLRESKVIRDNLVRHTSDVYISAEIPLKGHYDMVLRMRQMPNPTENSRVFQIKLLKDDRGAFLYPKFLQTQRAQIKGLKSTHEIYVLWQATELSDGSLNIGVGLFLQADPPPASVASSSTDEGMMNGLYEGATAFYSEAASQAKKQAKKLGGTSGVEETLMKVFLPDLYKTYTDSIQRLSRTKIRLSEFK